MPEASGKSRWLQPLTREGIRNDLLRRFVVRFHMSLIVAGSLGTAIIANKLLLVAGLETMWLRYLWAMVASYLAFLAGIKCWLLYAGYDWPRKSNLDVDLPDFSGGGSGGGAGPSGSCELPPMGGGGEFSGAGASGDFGEAGNALADTAGNVASGLGDAVSKAGGAVGDLGGGDEGGCALVLALILIAVVLAAIFGSAAYIVFNAPSILAEAVFEVLLAGGLVRASRRAEDASWVEGVFRATWAPFALILFVVMGFAVWAHAAYPQAHTVSQLMEQARQADEKK
ncbi:MAG: hypothetical protein HZC23_01950 [Rhodocyclales bacterium]|nr:hypothetical protein [Rhodocyclales bacterium]